MYYITGRIQFARIASQRQLCRETLTLVSTAFSPSASENIPALSNHLSFEKSDNPSPVLGFLPVAFSLVAETSPVSLPSPCFYHIDPSSRESYDARSSLKFSLRAP